MNKIIERIKACFYILTKKNYAVFVSDKKSKKSDCFVNIATPWGKSFLYDITRTSRDYLNEFLGKDNKVLAYNIGVDWIINGVYYKRFEDPGLGCEGCGLGKFHRNPESCNLCGRKFDIKRKFIYVRSSLCEIILDKSL